MTNLYERLIEVCIDQGIENPRPRDISSICGISSGRPKQIKDAGSAARLGSASLQKLSALGYSLSWLQEGKLPKLQPQQLASHNHQANQDRQEYKKISDMLSESEATLIDAYRKADFISKQGVLRLLGIEQHRDFKQSA